MERAFFLTFLLSTAVFGAPPDPFFQDVAADVGLVLPVTRGPAFAALTREAEILVQTNLGHGAAVGDYDGDGDLDVYLTAPLGEPNRLYRNQLVETGKAVFVDVTAPPLDDRGLGRLAYFADLDGDGRRDLLLINDDDGTGSALPSRLFRNLGNGEWADRTPDSGFRPPGYCRAGAGLADYDHNGHLDLYVTVWTFYTETGPSLFPGSNRLYRNLGAFRFEDATSAAGLGTLSRDSFTPVFTDFGGDTHADLFVAVDHTSDAFFVNRDGDFSDVTGQAAATHIGNDMGVAVGDFDDDGDLDLFTTNITDPTGRFGTTQGNALYVQQSTVDGVPRFAELAGEHGVADTYWAWGTEFSDVDNDGDLDLVTATGFDAFVRAFGGPSSPIYRTPTVLLLNDGAGNFTRKLGAGLDAAADSRTLIAADFDRDGDQDLLVTNVDEPVQLFENRTPGAGNWLTVALEPDALAFGAAVYAVTGGVTRRRDLVAGRSFLAGHPNEVHFGLGAATSVESLRVVWADGRETLLADVVVNQVLRLQEAPTPVELLSFTVD